MPRPRDMQRHYTERAIARKSAIIASHYPGGMREPGRLDKAKVHCSCDMCRPDGYDRRDRQRSLREALDFE